MQSATEIPETLATLGTYDTVQRHPMQNITTQKPNHMINTDPTKNKPVKFRKKQILLFENTRLIKTVKDYFTCISFTK